MYHFKSMGSQVALKIERKRLLMCICACTYEDNIVKNSSQLFRKKIKQGGCYPDDDDDAF